MCQRDPQACIWQEPHALQERMHRSVWLPGHKRQRVPRIVLQACLLKVEAEMAHILEVASCR